jgi:hypothetical protein
MLRADRQTDRQTDTDRRDKANGRFSQFCEHFEKREWRKVYHAELLDTLFAPNDIRMTKSETIR